MCIRIRNGRVYYRYKVWDDELKKYRHLERAKPIPGMKIYADEDILPLPATDIGKIFYRFRDQPSTTVALHLVYYYGIKTNDIYDLKISQADFRRNTLNGIPLRQDTVRLLKRHIDRIKAFSDGHLVVDLRNGKKMTRSQLNYVVSIIKKEINPDFSLKSFKSHKKPPL